MRIVFNAIICSSFFIFDVTQPMGKNKDNDTNQHISAFLDLNSVSRTIKNIAHDIKNQAAILTLFSLPLLTQTSNNSIPDPVGLYINPTIPFTFVTICGILCCSVACCTVLGKVKIKQLESEPLLAHKAGMIPIIVRKEEYKQIEDDTEIRLKSVSPAQDFNKLEKTDYDTISLSDDSD